MPGLVDMHVHLEDADDGTLYVANGVTAIRNMWGTAQTLIARADYAEGRALGPSVYTTGPVLDGNPVVWPGSAAIESPKSGPIAAWRSPTWTTPSSPRRQIRVTREARQLGCQEGCPHARNDRQRLCDHASDPCLLHARDPHAARRWCSPSSRERHVESLHHRWFFDRSNAATLLPLAERAFQLAPDGDGHLVSFVNRASYGEFKIERSSPPR